MTSILNDTKVGGRAFRKGNTKQDVINSKTIVSGEILRVPTLDSILPKTPLNLPNANFDSHTSIDLGVVVSNQDVGG